MIPARFRRPSLRVAILALLLSPDASLPSAAQIRGGESEIADSFVTKALMELDQLSARDARLDPKFTDGRLLELLEERSRLSGHANTIGGRLPGQDSRSSIQRRSAVDPIDLPMAGFVTHSVGAELLLFDNRVSNGNTRLVQFSGPGLIKVDLTSTPERASASDRNVIHISLFVNAALAPNESDEVFLLGMGGALIAFKPHWGDASNRSGKIFARHRQIGDPEGAWLNTGVLFHIKANGAVRSPIDLVARLDSGRGEWDLYVDGRIVLAGLGFSQSRGACWAYSPAKIPVEIGSIAITNENPLF